MESFSLQDYLYILKQRSKLFVIVAATILVLGLLASFQYSNYRSTAVVEIAQPELDASIMNAGNNVQAAMEAMADQQISRLQQKVLSIGSLAEIITKLNLYPEERKVKAIDVIAEKMRKKVRIGLLSTSLANPASAQKASANQLSAIAFTLSFDYTDPIKAQQTANELVSRFLDEDIKGRRNQAEETSAFLASQLKVLNEALAEMEKKIAEFRSAHGDVRPDALGFNQQAAVSLRMSLQNVMSQIAVNETQLGTLRGQLASVDPYSRVVADGRLMTTPSQQLKALRSDYATLTAKYGPQHPDVVKAEKQIKSLEAQTGSTGNAETADLQVKIDDIQTQLAAASKTKGDMNPEVKSLRAQLKSLQAQLAAAQSAGSSKSGYVTDADNPTYLQISAQLQAAEEQHKALLSQRDNYQKQLAKYEQAVVLNPETEKEFASLSRDYENAQLRYREIKAKKLAADMNETIEQDRSGQRLVVIDPPEMPAGTHPSRIIFILASFVFSFVAGSLAVILSYILTQSIVGPRHLEAVIGVAPFVTIPQIATANEIKTWDKRKLQSIGIIFLAGLIGLGLFSMSDLPLDVLLAMIARKLNLY